MARLFVAVWPPEGVLDTVAAIARPEVPGLKWTRREQWHVTLRFLGPVDDVAAVRTALAFAAAGVPPTQAVLGPAVGRFAHRVLHVPVSGLDALAAAVVQAARELGRPPEDRRFAGHLTLARVAKGSRVDLRPLAGVPAQGRWVVGDVCLVESRLQRSGARYEVVDRFPLLG